MPRGAPVRFYGWELRGSNPDLADEVDGLHYVFLVSDSGFAVIRVLGDGWYVTDEASSSGDLAEAMRLAAFHTDYRAKAAVSGDGIVWTFVFAPEVFEAAISPWVPIADSEEPLRQLFDAYQAAKSGLPNPPLVLR